LLQSIISKKNQPKDEICPQSLSPERAVSPHIQNLIPPADRKSDSPHAKGPTPLRRKERDSLIRQTSNEGLKIQRGEHGRIPQ